MEKDSEFSSTVDAKIKQKWTIFVWTLAKRAESLPEPEDEVPVDEAGAVGDGHNGTAHNVLARGLLYSLLIGQYTLRTGTMGLLTMF